MLINSIIISFSVENILFLKPEQEKDKTHFIDKDVSALNIQFCCLEK
jgi:hypothetical protein